MQIVQVEKFSNLNSNEYILFHDFLGNEIVLVLFHRISFYILFLCYAVKVSIYMLSNLITTKMRNIHVIIFISVEYIIFVYYPENKEVDF